MILLAVGSAPPAFAGKHVTIAQLEQILHTLEGKSKMPAFQKQMKSEFANVSLLRAELNEVLFTHYHLFHTQMRILEDR
jgi:hypothetical protein